MWLGAVFGGARLLNDRVTVAGRIARSGPNMFSAESLAEPRDRPWYMESPSEIRVAFVRWYVVGQRLPRCSRGCETQ
jgi:hypothetical protein